MLALKTIEVNFTDTNAQNYIRAEQVDAANLPSGTSFSYLRQYGSAQNPQFDDRGDWYEIFPAFTSSNNVTNAIRLIYYLKPTEYAATSDTVAYPESQDYRILGWRVTANYLYSLGTDKIQLADKFNSMYEQRVKEYCATLGRGSSQPIQATTIQLTGWEF